MEVDSTAMDLASSPVPKNETPSPPTAPVRVQKHDETLMSGAEYAPAAVDQFDAGTLEEDWFGEDTKGSLQLSLPAPTNVESDNDEPRNPMVAGDEDVESVEYYNEERKESISAVDLHKVDTDRSNGTTEDEEPVFKSRLEYACGAGQSIVQPANSVIASDSEDEDNKMRFEGNDLNWNFNADVIRSDSPYGFGGYEEIGGSSSNPWASDHRQHPIDSEETYSRMDDEKTVSIYDSTFIRKLIRRP